eukprot:CAMPEP_0117008008 /NCGR_PEP_ID=MMETSP0472-20121206/7683_1 /TAXON_ID=693140 ORGANISM="Tiarina fusus, Strain LIS" /NCGR_SAMPLE_ID=MMETSP0472 /ASSEMBLY_ACC=CAM_ASM_000603 /LENGTH=75 /DNA_ID=CAMNT_0004709937 /DNA_START=1191 /DNA_END=1418 /DNA_ORIENTATION=+
MRLTVGDTPLIRKINAIIQAVRAQHATHPPLYVIVQGGQQDQAFTFSMKEDRVDDTMSYADLFAYLNMTIAKNLR